MTITHKKESIDIKFSIKDLILAVGILECKLSKINLMYEDEIDIWIVTNECKGGFMYNNLDKILYKTIILTCEDIEFSVRSKTYNLEEEMGIICYYDLNDIYEDEILEGILREIKDIYMS